MVIHVFVPTTYSEVAVCGECLQVICTITSLSTTKTDIRSIRLVQLRSTIRGDVGSKAGFMLVGEDDEQFIGSNAPQFIDATPGMSYADLAMEAEGNYLRVTVDMTEKRSRNIVMNLQKLNPAGLTVICHTPIEKRVDRIEVKSSESLEATVDRYINELMTVNKDRL